MLTMVNSILTEVCWKRKIEERESMERKKRKEKERESKSQRASMNSSEKWFPIERHFLVGDIRRTTDLKSVQMHNNRRKSSIRQHCVVFISHSFDSPINKCVVLLLKTRAFRIPFEWMFEIENSSNSEDFLFFSMCIFIERLNKTTVLFIFSSQILWLEN